MTIGQIKIMIDRNRSYWQLVNTLILLYLFIKDVGWSWWFLIAIPLNIILIWWDHRYIIKTEMKYIHDNSPVLQEILRKGK